LRRLRLGLGLGRLLFVMGRLLSLVLVGAPSDYVERRRLPELGSTKFAPTNGVLFAGAARGNAPSGRYEMGE